MHEANTQSRTSRSGSNPPNGNQASPINDLEAGKTGQIPEALEDWRNKLLASGPNRGVSFEVEFRSKLVIRAFIGGAYARGRTLILLVRCPLRDHYDLNAIETLLDHFFRNWENKQ